jgi:hypothetical protein
MGGALLSPSPVVLCKDLFWLSVDFPDRDQEYLCEHRASFQHTWRKVPITPSNCDWAQAAAVAAEMKRLPAN